MKRIFAIIMSAALVLSLAACGGTGTSSSTAESSGAESGSVSTSPESVSTEAESVSTEAESVSTETESAAEDNAAAAGKTLVAYYSATGSTKTVAEIIARETGADLFEITPAEPYTSADLDWNASGSRVSLEHNDVSLRDIALVTVTPEDWAQYDTVFVGYPIWWGIAAWPVNGFVTGNDFAGKTVIPFCTSMSSGAGESGELLAAAANGGDWQSAQRFSSGADESTVAAWVADVTE